jgi:hypothetical protein
MWGATILYVLWSIDHVWVEGIWATSRHSGHSIDVLHHVWVLD